jgi:hypothetical protein
MHYAVTATTCTEAWIKAANYLRQRPGKSAYNLLLDVQSPHLVTQPDLQAISLLDDLLKKYDHYSVSTVAGTIFPQGLYARFGSKGVYETYPNVVYPRIKENSWGRYAYRIVRRRDGPGKYINPLELMVNKLKRQLQGDRTFRAVYELPTVEDQEIATYDASLDADRLLPHPCLSHLSFKVSEDNKQLMLTALYRSQYFFQKALGNLIGLAQLHRFVALETGLAPSNLVCLAALATLDTSGAGGVVAAEKLLDECASKYSQQSLPKEHVEAA